MPSNPRSPASNAILFKDAFPEGSENTVESVMPGKPAVKKGDGLLALVGMGPDTWTGLFCSLSTGLHATASSPRTRFAPFRTTTVDRISYPGEVLVGED